MQSSGAARKRKSKPKELFRKSTPHCGAPFRIIDQELQIALLDGPATILLRAPAGPLHLMCNSLIETVTEVSRTAETLGVHELFHF